jgi:nucleoside-diphosphate kinase
MQDTLSIIKPDGVRKKIVGKILKRFEDDGFEIINPRYINLSKEEASEFYNIHKGKPFFDDLIIFMTSGPCLPFIIRGENAILRVRELMGSTDPDEAAPETIRADFADSIDSNVIHGSDSEQSAKREIRFFFG